MPQWLKRLQSVFATPFVWLYRQAASALKWSQSIGSRAFTHAKRVAKSSDEQNRPVYVWLYGAIILLLLLMVIASFIGTAFIFSLESGWTATLAFVVVYSLLSYHQSKNDEGTAVWILSVPVWRQGPGPAFVPFGIGSYDPVPQAVLQREFPDEPEMVFKGKDSEPLKTAVDKKGETRQQVRPIRVTTGGPTPKEHYTGGQHLNHQMSVEQQATVRYSIDPERPFDFLIKLPGDKISEMFGFLEKQMEDTLIDTIRGEFTCKKTPDPQDATKTIIVSRSVGQVIADLDEIRDTVEKRLKELTHPWGVVIHEVTLKSPDITHEVNVALRSIAETSAGADAERNRGIGEGDRRGEYLARQAEGAKKAAQLTGMEPIDVLALDKAESIMKETDKIVLGIGGIAEALNLGPVMDAFGNRTRRQNNGNQGRLSQRNQSNQGQGNQGGNS